MSQIKADELDPAVYELFDDYVHDRIDRRAFLRRVGRYTAAGVSASAVLAFLAPNYAAAIQVAADDDRLNTQTVEYPSPKGGGTIAAQLSVLKDSHAPRPGVIVVHENRGLNPHIADVGRRAALAGFVSLAPDALSPMGGYPGNDDDGRALQRQRDRGEMLNDFLAAFEYLYNHPQCDGCIGVVGFCFGGWVANAMAVAEPRLRAAVPFYGSQPEAEQAAQIKAELMLHFAAQDERVNAGWPAWQAALKQHKVVHQAFTYANTQHGFHNDSTPRFDAAAAELAWQRTVDFFRRTLKKTG